MQVVKRFATILLTVTALLTGCSETSTDGAVLYGRLCGACHGSDLSGGVGQALGAGSAAADLTDAAYRMVITEGTPGMPATSSLDDGQLEALIAYIRQVQGR